MIDNPWDDCIFQAYMLKYDSTHGRFKGTINVVDESTLEINGKQIKVTNQRYSHVRRLANRIIDTYVMCRMSFLHFHLNINLVCAQRPCNDSLGWFWSWLCCWIFWCFYNTRFGFSTQKGKSWILVYLKVSKLYLLP